MKQLKGKERLEPDNTGERAQSQGSADCSLWRNPASSFTGTRHARYLPVVYGDCTLNGRADMVDRASDIVTV